MDRRTWIKAGATAAAALAAGLGAEAFLLEPHDVELVRRPMPLDALPEPLVGRTLLHVSDIHVGPHVASDYLIRTFSSARELAPDLVALTGDFVSQGTAREHAELARVLRHLPRGRLGTIASLGNHDYGVAWRELDVADLVGRVVEDAGAVVLRNATHEVAGLRFAGLADFWSPEFGTLGGAQPAGLLAPGRDRPASAPAPSGRTAESVVRSLASAAPTVILSHNPDVQDLPIWQGVRGWVLAGHTHGGQVKPPFLPPPILPVQNRRYTAGAFDLGAGRTMYINRGLGHLNKVRFNCRPELTLFTLARA